MPTVRFQLRRDTAANWTSVNPTLGPGEPALETDTGKRKYGNGANAWNDLPYAPIGATDITDATAVGRALLTLANPSAVRFLRLNADNSVSPLDATAFRAAIGAGTSSTSGTVTSVDASGGTTGLTFTGGAITGSGTLTLGGTLGVANGGTGASSFTSGYLLRGSGTAAIASSGLFHDVANNRLGFGTATPGYLLHLVQNGNAEIRVAATNVSGNEAGITIENSGQRNWNIWADRANDLLRIGFGNRGTTLISLNSGGWFIPGTDNSQQHGHGGARWKEYFAGTGVINTSDEREKLWRGSVNEAEARAAHRIIGELGFYQWTDAARTKGDDARLHFGARAQKVWAIMAEEGLVDPIGEDGRPGRTPYAFLCFDEWPAEHAQQNVAVKRKRKRDGKMVMVEELIPTGEMILTREAGSRFSLRVDQLTLFLFAVLMGSSANPASTLPPLASVERPSP